MSCKGSCEHHRAEKESLRGYYINGYKRCQVCDIYLNWEGFYSPCCGRKLRAEPRNKKLKMKMKIMKRDIVQLPLIA